MRRLFKWSKRVILGLGVLSILLLVAVITMFTTATGTRWAIERISAAAPGEITLNQLEGTLWSGLKVAEFRYLDEETEIAISKLVLDIDWSRSMLKQLVINRIEAGTLSHRSRVPAPAEQRPVDLQMSPLPVSLHVTSGVIDQLIISGEKEPLSLTDITFDRATLEGNGHQLQIEMLSLSSDDIVLSAKNFDGQLAGSIPFSSDINWSLRDYPWSGVGRLNGSTASLLFEQAVSGPYPFSVSGSADLGVPDWPELDVQLAWQQWQTGQISLQNGKLQARGVTGDYVTEFDFTALLPDAQQVTVSATANGNIEGFTVFEAKIESAVGKASVGGDVNWKAELAANGRIDVEHFDPSAWFPQFSGQLKAQAEMSLSGGDTVSFADAVVTGIVNNASVDARGNIRLTPDRMRCTACVLKAANNQVRVDGVKDADVIDLQLSIDAPALDMLWPDLAGKLEAEGRLHGPYNSPLFAGRAQGWGLSLADWSVQELGIDGQGAGTDKVNLSVDANGLAWGANDLGRLRLNAQGAVDAFSLDATWLSGDYAANATIDIERQGESAAGVVKQAQIAGRHAGEWILTEPFSFLAGQQGFDIGPHQWAQDSSLVQVESFAAGASGTELVAGIKDLPLSSFNMFLPPNYQLHGTANAGANLALTAGVWSGSIHWQQTATVLEVLQEGGNTSNVSIPLVDARASLADGGAKVQAALAIDPGVTAGLELSLDEISTESDINARLELQGNNWGWVSAVIPEIDRFEGNITANMRGSGSMLSPQIDGSMNWRDGRLVVPALNVPIDDIEIALTGGSNGTARLVGSARAGEGNLQVEGQFNDIMVQGRSAEFRITGEIAELMNWPEYHLWASPDIVATANSAGWNVNGLLTVPRAEISLRELPTEVTELSEDVKVVGVEEKPTRPTTYTGEVQLVLGDQVRVQLLGLDTRLGGKLFVRVPKGLPPAAEGQLELVGGKFTAYGQKLTIQEGTLTFTGALDNPIVDVRAVRVIETLEGPVTAGIHLEGRALNLRTSVFSTPSMAESDALSYLVIGRPLNQATVTEGSSLASSAIALGLGQATRVTEQIGRTVGLDQLALTGDGGQGTALVAGKQINTRLHARYAYGVFSRLGTLLMRYRLSRRLVLEAGAGEKQTIDILYTVEKQ